VQIRTLETIEIACEARHHEAMPAPKQASGPLRIEAGSVLYDAARQSSFRGGGKHWSARRSHPPPVEAVPLAALKWVPAPMAERFQSAANL
jgi:hypothetical protein